MVQRSWREGKGAEREEEGKEQKNRRGGNGCQTFWQKALPRVELGKSRGRAHYVPDLSVSNLNDFGVRPRQANEMDSTN